MISTLNKLTKSCRSDAQRRASSANSATDPRGPTRARVPRSDGLKGGPAVVERTDGRTELDPLVAGGLGWHTTGRRRCCAARQIHSSTQPPTAPAGCFSRLLRQQVWPGPFEPGPPDPKFEFGRWPVTAPGPGVASVRTRARRRRGRGRGRGPPLAVLPLREGTQIDIRVGNHALGGRRRPSCHCFVTAAGSGLPMFYG